MGGVMPFPKVKVIAKMELELVYYDAAVQDFSHYATDTCLGSAVKKFYQILNSEIQ